MLQPWVNAQKDIYSVVSICSIRNILQKYYLFHPQILYNVLTEILNLEKRRSKIFQNISTHLTKKRQTKFFCFMFSKVPHRKQITQSNRSSLAPLTNSLIALYLSHPKCLLSNVQLLGKFLNFILMINSYRKI